MGELSLDDLIAELRNGARAILQVRHAERPQMDPTDPTFGDSLPITAEGERTARLLGERLREFAPATAFYASPLRRTRLTAAAIAAGMGMSNASVPTDPRLGNSSFYYDDPSQVLELFAPGNFFNACFAYFRGEPQRGLRDIRQATDEYERWQLENARSRVFMIVTHDCYIAAFLSQRGAVGEFTRDNWPRFLDIGATLIAADGSRRYALVRTGLSQGICGIGGKVL